MRHLYATAAALVLAVGAGTPARAVELFSFDRDTSELVRVDAANGAVTTVGTVELPIGTTVRSMTVHRGALLAVIDDGAQGPRSLVEINAVTAEVETTVELTLDGAPVLVDGIASNDTTLFAAYRSDPGDALMCADAIASVERGGALAPLVIYPLFAECDLGTDIDAFAVDADSAGLFRGFNRKFYGDEDPANAIELFQSQLHPGTYVVVGSPPELHGAAVDTLGDLAWTSGALYTVGTPFPDLEAPQLLRLDALSGQLTNVIVLDRAGSYAGLAAIAAPCAADLDGNGTIDGADLGSLLGAWGPCATCAADLDADGTVDGADLGLLLGAWGPCP